jgi:hypothetical protein
MGVATPPQLTEAFATSGTANTIPVPSQTSITPGAASFTDGFPPLTATPIASGGIPPTVADMNGILKMVSAHTAYVASGAGYQYSSAISTAIGGYNIGAVLLAADNTGYWFNTVANNTANPDTAGTGWTAISQYGWATITVGGSNITLTPAQWGKSGLNLIGTLTANITITVPNIAAQTWYVINETSGAFTITIKSSGTFTVVVPQGAFATSAEIVCDGSGNIYSQAGSFVSSASLAASLASYVTSASLASTLSGYVTTSSLASQLGSYDTISARNAALANYLTTAAVAAGYVSNSALSSALASYLTSAAAASTYVSASLLSTTLSAYITSSVLASNLSAYITASALASNLANYLPKSLIQSGTTPMTASLPGTYVAFGTPFPTICTSVVIVSFGQNATTAVLDRSQSGFHGINGANGYSCWIATGY